MSEVATGNHAVEQSERVRTKRINPVIDWSKPVWTKSGRLPVDVLTTNGRNKHFPVLVYVGQGDCVTAVTLDGKLGIGNMEPVAFENVPEFEKVVLNFYACDPEQHGGNSFIITQHKSKAEADLLQGHRVHVLEVEVPK